MNTAKRMAFGFLFAMCICIATAAPDNKVIFYGIINQNGTIQAVVDCPGIGIECFQKGASLNKNGLIADINATSGILVINQSDGEKQFVLNRPEGFKPDGILLELRQASPRALAIAYQTLCDRTILSTDLNVAEKGKDIVINEGTSPAEVHQILLKTFEADWFIRSRVCGDKFTLMASKRFNGALKTIPDCPIEKQATNKETIPPRTVLFRSADDRPVYEIFGELYGRIPLFSASMPSAKYTLIQNKSLTRSELIWAMNTLFRLHGIDIKNVGEKFVCIGTSNQLKNVDLIKAPKIKDGDKLVPEMLFLKNAPFDLLLASYTRCLGLNPGVSDHCGAIFGIAMRSPVIKKELIQAIAALAALDSMAFEEKPDGTVCGVRMKARF